MSENINKEFYLRFLNRVQDSIRERIEELDNELSEAQINLAFIGNSFIELEAIKTKAAYNGALNLLIVLIGYVENDRFSEESIKAEKESLEILMRFANG